MRLFYGVLPRIRSRLAVRRSDRRTPHKVRWSRIVSIQKDQELQDLHNQMHARSEALKRQIVTEIAFLPESTNLIAWREMKKVVAVPHDGKSLYPAFQFDNQQGPLPIVEQILRLFGEDVRRTDWQNLFWFISANAWLRGQSPQQCLTDRPEAVIDAATQEMKSDDY